MSKLKKIAVTFDRIGFSLSEGHKINLNLLLEGGSSPITFRVESVDYDAAADETRVNCLNEVNDTREGVLVMSSPGFLQGQGNFIPAS